VTHLRLRKHASSDDIISDRLAAIGTTPHARLSLMIIADLQKAGYRIVRHKDLGAA
jgi:hypothetical protein